MFYLLRQEPEKIRGFGEAVLSLSKNIRRCSECGAVTDADPCAICTDPLRDRRLICVVENEEDCVAMEQAGIFNGLTMSSAAGRRRSTTKRFPKRVSNVCGAG